MLNVLTFGKGPKSTKSAQPQKRYMVWQCSYGGNTPLNGMMKTISKDANCSFEYTNHCLRAMSITVLDHAGFPSRDIMTVSGHKSESSIKNYAQTSDQQKVNMSDTLSSALGNRHWHGEGHKSKIQSLILNLNRTSLVHQQVDNKPNKMIQLMILIMISMSF